MKKAILAAALALSACSDTVPPPACMAQNEVGAVVSVGTENYMETVYEYRSSHDEKRSRPIIKYRMKNGSMRVCTVDTDVNLMLQPGDPIQGAFGERRL